MRPAPQEIDMSTTAPGPRHAATRQQRLAASLSDCLGLDNAITACRGNCWDGVLVILLAWRAEGRT